MTGRAVCLFDVLGVIKMRAKACHRRKRFEISRVLSRVANRADRVRFVLKLLRVTARAGGVR